ncbi:hypothetical protein L596_001017 [Steinernema carpocapsae]|uniref:Uncharacterized protein n=1 Tax=Steinernema carpocapsae TaxID=34508 RepID=A0A4U8UMC5_STECR|nr:hypothetical protein L596_001017 [Steinernema carpocapsae]
MNFARFSFDIRTNLDGIPTVSLAAHEFRMSCSRHTGTRSFQTFLTRSLVVSLTVSPRGVQTQIWPCRCRRRCRWLSLNRSVQTRVAIALVLAVAVAVASEF